MGKTRLRLNVANAYCEHCVRVVQMWTKDTGPDLQLQCPKCHIWIDVLSRSTDYLNGTLRAELTRTMPTI